MEGMDRRSRSRLRRIRLIFPGNKKAFREGRRRRRRMRRTSARAACCPHLPRHVPGRIWHLDARQHAGEPVATTSSGLIPRSFLMSCCKDTPSAPEAQAETAADTDRKIPGIKSLPAPSTPSIAYSGMRRATIPRRRRENFSNLDGRCAND